MSLRDDALNGFCAYHALELERDLALLHRSRGGTGYADAVDRLRRFLGDSTIVRRYPAGTTCEGFIVPPPWNLKGGFARLTDGAWIVPDLRVAPIGAIFLSGPSRGVERLSLVDAGTGTAAADYDQSVEGCAVLANGKPSDVYREAVLKRGARCIFTDYMPAQDGAIGRTSQELPDTVSYTSFGTEAGGEGFGFNICHRVYCRLQDMAKVNRVSVDVSLDVDGGTGDLQVLETRVGKPGRGDPLLLLAHLCHPRPGANDNASGSALLAELMRTLGTLPLEREVVGLWVPEFYGTIAWLSDQKPVLAAAINLDMVGEDQQITGSTLEITSTPWSLPSFLSDLLAVNLAHHDFRMIRTGFQWGSDHAVLSDASVRIPAPSLTQWPDRYYHSSDDTPDKSSVASFAWIGSGVLSTLIDLCEGIPEERASTVAARLHEQCVIDRVRSDDAFVRDWIVRRTRAALLALRDVADTPAVRSELSAIGQAEPLPAFRHATSILGPLQDAWMMDGDAQWNDQLLAEFPPWSAFRGEVVNFLQLGLSRDEALTLSGAEFGASPAIFDACRRYLDLLTERGFLLR